MAARMVVSSQCIADKSHGEAGSDSSFFHLRGDDALDAMKNGGGAEVPALESSVAPGMTNGELFGRPRNPVSLEKPAFLCSPKLFGFDVDTKSRRSLNT